MERGNLEDVGVFLAQELYEITAEDLHGMSLSERTKGIFYITILSSKSKHLYKAIRDIISNVEIAKGDEANFSQSIENSVAKPESVARYFFDIFLNLMQLVTCCPD